MILLVTVNGIACQENVDYVYRPIDRDIMFCQAPRAGDYINVNSGVRGKVWYGDGFTTKFKVDDLAEDKEYADIVNRAWRLRAVPAIAEAIEKLKVLVELADGGTKT